MRDPGRRRKHLPQPGTQKLPARTYTRSAACQLRPAPHNVSGAFVCAGPGWVTDGEVVLLNLFPCLQHAICPLSDKEREGAQLSPLCNRAAVGQRKLISITLTLYGYCYGL